MTSVSLKEWVSPNKSIDQTEGNGMAAVHLPVFGAIKVAVRVRPLTPQESLNHVHTSVEVDEDNSYVIAAESRQNQPRKFTFDEVLGPTCSQALVFSKCVAQSVDAFFDGYNSTVMAYGQTGSGKTHTMSQIVPEVVRNLFQAIDARKEDGTQCHLVIQYVELYNEELRDLLLVAKVPAQANQASPPSSGGRGDHPLLGSTTSYRTASNINIRETAEGEIFLEGCREIPVNNAFELMSWIAAGNAVRSTAVTHLNETSSRSHSILILSLQQQLPPSPDSGEVEILSSKLNLIDLAGSERTKKSRVEGSRLKEAVSINQGLLALGNVISALGDVQRRGCHVPYRDSKLTRMLQDSLGGNSFTTLIACVSGSFDNLEETVNTLKYANRARNIQNRAVINKEMLRGADGLSDEQRAMALLKQVVIQLPVSQGCSTTLIQLLEASQYSHKACVLAIQRLKMVILGHASSELPMDSSTVEQMRTENALLTDTVQDHEATLEQIAMLVTTLGNNVTDAARDAILQRVSVSIPDIIQKIRPPLTSTQHSHSSLTSGLNSHPLSLTTIHEHSDSPYPTPVPFITGALVRSNSGLPNSREPTVTELQAQLSSCATELARTCAELRSAKADLDRDEMIFATKQQEVVSLQLALQESTLEAERLRAEQLEIMQRMSPLVRTSVLMEEGEQVRGETAAELVDLALSQSHQILQLPQSDGTTTYHSRRYDGANQLESAPAPDGELVLFDEEALSSRCSDTDDDSGSRFESKGGSSEDQSVKAKVSVQALVSAFEHKSRIDRRRAQVEQETAQQARLFKDERVQMEAQILQLEKSIKDQENEITKLLAAEEQARVANHLYKAQVHTLRQEVEEKESEANGLMYQLLELGSNQMRNEEEKARLLIECEKKIDEANKQVNEMKNKLHDKEQSHRKTGAKEESDRMHAEVERLRSQQNMLKQDLVVKAVEQERQSHQKAKELVMLRKAVDTAQRRVLLLEEETRKQKQVIQLREKEAISDKQRIRELMQQPSVEKTEERATGSTPRGRGSRQSLGGLGNSLAWNAGSARPHQNIQTQTLPLSKARAVIPPLTSSAPPARHHQWLQKLLECTSVKRQAIKELSTAQRHLLSASEQQRQLENEKMKLVQRMQVRMEAMEAKADALTAAKQEIMAQIEDHASRVSSNRGGSPHMKTLLHDLARQAEEVQEEADLEELHRRLSEIDGQEQRVRAACEEDGAWTKLQMHERQAVEKIEGLLEQLRGRQDAIEARAIGRQEAYHQAVEAEEQLRNNVPDMNLVEMKAAFQRIIDVVSASGMTQQSNNHTSSVDLGSQPQKAIADLGPDSILNTELMRESVKHGPAKVSSIGQHPSSILHPSSHLTSGMVSSGRVTSLSGIKSRGASPSPYRPPVTTPSSSLSRRLAYHPGRATTPGRRFQSREGQSGAVVPGRGSWGGGEADRQAQPASPTRARSLSYGGGEIKAQAGITNRGQLSSDGVKRRQSPFVMARRQLPGRSAMHSSILDNEHTALHHSRSGRILAWDSEGPAVQGSKHTAAHDSASSDPFAEAISLEREVTLQQLQATSSSYCTVVTVRPSKVMMYTADTANHDLLSLPCTGEAFSASVGDEFTASTRGFSKAGLSSHSLQHVPSADFRPSALSVASDGSKTGPQKVYSSSNDSKDKAPSCFLNSGQYEGFESHAKLQQTECTTAAAGGGLGGVLRSSLLASSTTPSKTPVLHPFWSALKPQQRAIMSDWGTPDVYSKVQD